MHSGTAREEAHTRHMSDLFIRVTFTSLWVA